MHGDDNDTDNIYITPTGRPCLQPDGLKIGTFFAYFTSTHASGENSVVLFAKIKRNTKGINHIVAAVDAIRDQNPPPPNWMAV